MTALLDGRTNGVMKRAVVIGNGIAGAENQCIGLIRALGLTSRYSLYRVKRPTGGVTNNWLRWLPLSLHKKISFFISGIVKSKNARIFHGFEEADAYHIARMARDTFEREGPLLVVASGRDTIPVSSTIRRLAPDNVFVVQIQHPRSRLNRFDLVIAPRHDYYPLTPEGRKQIPWFLRWWITPREPPDRHVVLTAGALHCADSAALWHAASLWHDELASLPRPLLVVNIGGPTGNCQYGMDLARQLAETLHEVLWSCRSLRISFSRRTPKEVETFLAKEFGGNPKVYIWDGKGPNPHMGHLALADAFVVTADSVSMLSEACSTGKPVYVVGAERCTWKFADFQKRLQERGVVRPFTGNVDVSETWSYRPLDDAAEAARHVIEELAKRGWTIGT